MAHSHKPENKKPKGPDSKLVSLVAQFDDPDSLVAACDRARQEGYKKMDAYSPFPVHGIDEAIGIRRTRLPFFVLAVAFCGCAFALGLQYYVNSTDESPIFPGYKFFISGKPLGVAGVPANIPVTFEIIVLSSAFATFFGMWILNGLPKFANPLHRISRFRRVTNDKFFLVLDVDDEKFSNNRSRQQLEEWGATAIEECHMDMTDHEIPKIFKMAGIVLLFALMLPPVLIYRAAGMTSRAPRLHVVPDMDWQDKFKTQTAGPNMGADSVNPDYLFADPRTMRAPIAGTVARGELFASDALYRGYNAGEVPASEPPAAGGSGPNVIEPLNGGEQDGAVVAANEAAAVVEPNWVTSFPEGIEVSEATMMRGKQRYEIYCVPCHGYDGNGRGLVNERAVALAATGNAQWTQVKSVHDPAVKSQAVGRIYDTITNGRGTMGPYASQIPSADRWAIVMYVKALQETGIAPPIVVQEAAAEAPQN